MKIKTSELIGAALDWAVAKCEGMEFDLAPDGYYIYKPSSNWAMGGPIIEREQINLWTEGYDWEATQYGKWQEWGPTALIAAMRCYVGTKLGNEVEVPDELLQGETK